MSKWEKAIIVYAVVLSFVFAGVVTYATNSAAKILQLKAEAAETADRIQRLGRAIDKAYDASVRMRVLIEFDMKRGRLEEEWKEWMEPAWENTLEILTEK